MGIQQSAEFVAAVKNRIAEDAEKELKVAELKAKEAERLANEAEEKYKLESAQLSLLRDGKITFAQLLVVSALFLPSP